MLKICYIIGQLSMDGAERQLYELVKGINKEQFHPVVISLSKGGYWADKIRELDVQVIELERRQNKEFRRLFGLMKLLRAMKPEIVHTYMFSANSYGRIASILSGVPVTIASERNLPEIGMDKDVYQLCIDRFLFLFSHGVICNSYKAAESLVKKYLFNAKKILTVHNGINIGEYPEISGRKSFDRVAPKVVGTIGRLCPQKNQKLFLDVAKKVLETTKDREVRFVIVGDGPLRNELEDYSVQLQIEDNVTFTGARTDIPNLLHGMDIFVMTSHYEGMSNAIMEAMSAGLPVVATDVGGNGEMIIDKETGLLCPPNDSKSLVEKVMFLLDNDEEAVRMGKRGRMRIEKEFGVDKMVRATEAFYLSLAKRYA